MDTDMPEWKGVVRDPGSYVATVKIPPHLLKPGRYYLSFASFIEGVKVIEQLDGVLTFEVSQVGYTLNLNRWGLVSPPLDWRVCRFNENGRIA